MDSTQEMPMEAPYMPVLVDDLVRTRKRRKDCFLSIGERKAIEPFKERFKSEPSRERRVTMVKSEVMVAYFNYLHSQKQTPKTPEELKEKTKFLSAWIANNWRSSASMETGVVNMKVRLIDLVWRKKRMECEAELKEMLGVDELDPSSAAYFRQRLAAAKRVTDSLGTQEREELEAELKQIKQQGYEKEIQQEMALKYGNKRIEKFAKERWLEMGMMTLTFAAYTLPDGRLAVTAHDNMAALSQTNIRSFTEKHRDLVDNVKRSMLHYTKAIAAASGQVHDDADEVEVEPATQISLTEDRFPVLPAPAVWIRARKVELEKVLRAYMAYHYTLASKGRSLMTPYTELTGDAWPMVNMKYLVRRDIFKDLRNMPKEDIVDQLKHIHDRQVQFGPEDAFRFSQYKSGRELHPAEYNGEERRTKRKKKKAANKAEDKRTKKTKKTGKQKQSDPPADTNPGMPAINADDLHAFVPAFDLIATDGEVIDQQTRCINPMVIDPSLLNLTFDGQQSHSNLDVGHSAVAATDGGMPDPVGQAFEHVPDSDETTRTMIVTMAGPTLSTTRPAINSKPKRGRAVAEVVVTDEGKAMTTRSQAKRKRTHTADDLALEEAARYGVVGNRRRGAANRK